MPQPEYPSSYVCSRQVRLKIEVKECGGPGNTEQRGRITVDRDSVSYDKLRKHFIKLFRLSSSFLVTCQVRKDTFFPITDDWDLDAALQQCRHTMKVVVHCSLQQSVATSPSFEILSTSASMPHTALHRTPIRQNSLPVCGTGSRGSSSNSKSQSMLHKFVNKLSKFIFSNKSCGSESSLSSLEVEPVGRAVKPAMTTKEFLTFFDCEGRLIDEQAFRESVYRGGVSNKLRKTVWRHLLNAFPEGMSGIERESYLQRKADEYFELRRKWKLIYQGNSDELPDHIRVITTMVKKDVVRTDRKHPYYRGREDNKHIISLFDILCTYALNHPDVSYCQGMCDYASTLLLVQDDEANAYLLFCALMERIKHNFSHDGKAITTKFDHLTQLLKHFDKEFYSYLQERQTDDLLFSYRWILLEMKREFPYEQYLYFSEVMWSTVPVIPRSCDVPLYQLTSSTDSVINPRMQLLSPYARLNDSVDQFADDLSDVSTDDNRSTIALSELSMEQEERDRAVSIENALGAEDDSTAGRSTSCRHMSLSTLSEPSSSICQCNLDEMEPVKGSESSSVFYIELEQQDYCFDTATDDLTSLGPPSADVCRCGGSGSTDSGFQSRPVSPMKYAELGNSCLDESVELYTSMFPLPHELGFGNPFVIFAALIMILNHREEIIEANMDFNEILMLFNGAMRKNDVHKILSETRMVYEAYIRNELAADDDDFVHI